MSRSVDFSDAHTGSAVPLARRPVKFARRSLAASSAPRLSARTCVPIAMVSSSHTPGVTRSGSLAHPIITHELFAFYRWRFLRGTCRVTSDNRGRATAVALLSLVAETRAVRRDSERHLHRRALELLSQGTSEPPSWCTQRRLGTERATPREADQSATLPVSNNTQLLSSSAKFSGGSWRLPMQEFEEVVIQSDYGTGQRFWTRCGASQQVPRPHHSDHSDQRLRRQDHAANQRR